MVEVWLTKGLFGEKTEKIADAADGKEAIAALRGWKNSEASRDVYKVEKYDRFLFGEDGVAVDFGDYATFVLFVGEGVKEQINKAFSFGKESGSDGRRS